MLGRLEDPHRVGPEPAVRGRPRPVGDGLREVSDQVRERLPGLDLREYTSPALYSNISRLRSSSVRAITPES